MADIQLIHGDCMEYMATLKDKAFDLAICDPPYGIGDFSNKTENKKRNVTRGKFGGTYKWNNSIPPIEYFTELRRVSKERIIWGANYYNSFESGGAIVWYKHTKHPNYSDCEIASYSKGVRVSFVSLEWYSLNRCEETIHPCQKPVALYDWILRNYAKPGQRILDTHLGSGSSAIAAYYFGCDFVGCEIDADYFNAAKERFERETRQVAMF